MKAITMIINAALYFLVLAHLKVHLDADERPLGLQRVIRKKFLKNPEKGIHRIYYVYDLGRTAFVSRVEKIRGDKLSQALIAVRFSDSSQILDKNSYEEILRANIEKDEKKRIYERKGGNFLKKIWYGSRQVKRDGENSRENNEVSPREKIENQLLKNSWEAKTFFVERGKVFRSLRVNGVARYVHIVISTEMKLNKDLKFLIYTKVGSFAVKEIDSSFINRKDIDGGNITQMEPFELRKLLVTASSDENSTVDLKIEYKENPETPPKYVRPIFKRDEKELDKYEAVFPRNIVVWSIKYPKNNGDIKYRSVEEFTEGEYYELGASKKGEFKLDKDENFVAMKIKLIGRKEDTPFKAKIGYRYDRLISSEKDILGKTIETVQKYFVAYSDSPTFDVNFIAKSVSVSVNDVAVDFIVYTTPCWKKDCHNGGSCILDASLVAGSRCDCKKGYKGERCQIRDQINNY